MPIKFCHQVVNEIGKFPEEDQDRIDFFITDKLGRHGLLLQKEGLVKKLTNDLYELKIRAVHATYRILFTIKNSVIWLLVAFKKKSQQIKRKFIDLALMRAASI